MVLGVPSLFLATIPDLLRHRSTTQPHGRAYAFLGDDGRERESLTYAELERRARRVAGALQQHRARGERVVLLYPPGLDYIVAFYGCLLAGAIAVPAYPPRQNRHLERLAAILRDADARLILTDRGVAAKLEGFDCLATDELPELPFDEVSIRPEDIAFLQYTSGSTSLPKGVCVTHANLVHNEEAIRRAFGVDRESVVVGWLPLYHDMGLIGTVLQPLYAGATAVLMSPAAFLQRPALWLEAIARYRGTISGGPNFAYDLVARVRDDEKDALDLSSWRVAFNGAEPIRPDTLARFSAAFARCGFRPEAHLPCYGLAEATLFVTGATPVRVEDGRVSCGPPGEGVELRIADASGEVVPDGATGEIVVTGPSVAGGYWRRPAETAETFGARIAGDPRVWLRTGDLGVVRGGELFVTARIKDLIVIRGRNHYPQDIEQTVERVDRALRPGCGAAFAIDADDGEQLVIVQEVGDRDVDADAVFAAVRAAIADAHELAAYDIVLIRRGALPKTSSGKVQRRACRDLYLRGELLVVASSRVTNDAPAATEAKTPLEWLRADIAARAGIPLDRIDSERSAASYGIDSLRAIEWTRALELRFGVRTSLARILGGATLAEIAAGGGNARQVAALDETTLTAGERALVFTHQLAPASTAYHIALAFDVPDTLDAGRLRAAIAALVRRHAALRKSFTAERALVHDEVDGWWHDDAAGIDAPFDISRAPLFRVALDGRTLRVVFHHLICDFRSLEVLARELSDVYAGGALPPAPPRVALAEGDDAFWREELEGAPLVLDLPTDRPRPRVMADRGAARAMRVDAKTLQAIEGQAQARGATLNATLLAAFELVLAHHSGQRDFLVGIPYAARAALETADTVGYLVNTIVHRARIDRRAVFPQQIEKTQRELAQALAHADVPFARLVDVLQPQRDPSRSPLFQAMFVFQSGRDDLALISHGEPGVTLRVGEATLVSRAPARRSAQFDVTLRAARLRDGIALVLEYNTDLFDGSTAEALLASLRGVLEGQPLASEQQGPARPYDLTRPLHEHFVREGTLTFEGTPIGYDELHRRAKARAAEIRPGTIVPVVMERSLELVIELVAILEAGAAYLPIDPADPEPRRRTLVEEAAGVPAEGCAYAIYTSGSTGRPKGVLNTHAGIVNRLLWMQEAFGLTSDDAVLQKTPYTFDVSVWELFWPLMTGARLVVAKPGGHRDPDYLAALIERERITTVHFVPAMLRAFLDMRPRCPSLRRVICSGEALTPDLAERFFAQLPHVELHNLYGPTEAAVDVTWWQCRPGDAAVPIGRPVANTTIAILDGELHIGGVQLARGYLARPDLTAERFVPAPHGQRLYRTGDLARCRPDGAIEYLGRADGQVKVRGVRIEPGEIEAALRRHPRVRDAVVVARAPRRSTYNVDQRVPGGMTEFRLFLKGGEAEETREAALVAYVTGDVTAADVRAHLSDALPSAMVPSAFVVLDALPLTSSGKVDRKALPERGVIRDHAYVAPHDAREARICALWTQVLQVDGVGAEDNFFDLGGDSIRALQLRARAEEEGIRFALQDLFTHQTPAALAAIAVFDAAAAEAPLTPPFSLIPDEDRARLPEGVVDAYPLSRVQAGLIYHLNLEPDTAIYHDVFVYALRARFDEAAFRRAAQQVVDRHPILRTSFDMAAYSEPLQLVHQQVPAAVEVLDFRPDARAAEGGTREDAPTDRARDEQRAWIEREKHEPVDLSRRSQMRFAVHRMTDDELQLVLSFYDTILDGWSTSTLLTELLTRYAAALAGRALPPAGPPKVTYRDFVALERTELANGDHLAFWARTLDEAEPTRVPRSGATAEGKRAIVSVDVPLSAETSRRLKDVARMAGTPLKHVLLAAHLRVVGFLSGQQDIVTGLESNGRVERADGEQSLGVHINTLPLRQTLRGGTWLQLIRDTFANERDLLPHRRMPLFDLLKQRGRDDLFETVFNYTHFHVFQPLASIDGIEVRGAWGFEETNFDLRAEFNRNPFTDRVQLDLVANLGALSREHVEQIAAFYAATLEAIAHDPNQRYEATPAVSRAAERTVDAVRHAGAATMQALLLAGAKTGGVRFGGESIAYEELDARAARLARALRAHGAGPDVPIALSMERGIDAIVALLAIVKAGGAVLPLDPTYPRARREAMLAASGATIVLDGAEMLAGDAELPRIEPEHLLNLIYTSGSTGRPKGVAMTHRAIADLVAWQAPRFGHDERILQFASLSFDVAYQEIFTAFATGATLVLIDEETRRDPQALLAYIVEHEVTRLFLPFVAVRGSSTRRARAAGSRARCGRSSRPAKRWRSHPTSAGSSRRSPAASSRTSTAPPRRTSSPRTSCPESRNRGPRCRRSARQSPARMPSCSTDSFSRRRPARRASSTSAARASLAATCTIRR